MISNVRRFLLFLIPCAVFGWTSSAWTSRRRATSSSALKMNLFSDIGDMLTGGALVPQSNLPYSSPLCPETSISSESRVFCIEERPLSFTGEDFNVCDAQTREQVARVRGALLHLPGKDKMSVNTSCGKVAELDRKLVAVSPTYDILRGNGEKLGWIEKKVVALTDTFDVYMEGEGGIGPFKPPPAYRLEGDFIDRNFCMKNDKNEVVAKVAKDGLIQFDEFNHYQVQVAPGMDAMLVISCACALDEEFDEEHKERKKKEEQGGGWF